MTLQHLLDELPAIIASAPVNSLGAVIIQLAACQSAVAARLLIGELRGEERKKPIIEDDALLTIAQVAERLNVPKTFAYELVRQHKLVGVRIGKYVRVGQEVLAKYIARAASLP